MDRGTDSPEAALQRLVNQASSVSTAVGWAPPEAWVRNAYNTGKSGSNTWDDFWRRNKLVVAQDVKCDQVGGAPCDAFAKFLEQAYQLGREAGGQVVPPGFWKQAGAVGTPTIVADSAPPKDDTRRWIWAGIIVATGSMLIHLLWRKK